MPTDKVRVMAKIFIDIVTGTWGNAEDVVIVDLNDVTNEHQDEYHWLNLLSEGSDFDRTEFGKDFGKPVVNDGR